MKRIMKYISLLCAAALLAGTLSACGGSSGGGGGSADSGGSDGAASEAAESEKYTPGDYTLPIVSEPTEITYMVRDVEEPGVTFMSGLSLAWNKFMEDTGITIVFDVIPNEDYWTQMPIRLASGTNLPDMVSVVGESDGSTLVKYFDEGVLMDILPLINEYAPNIKRYMEKNPEFKTSLTLPGGQIVCMSDAGESRFNSNQSFIRQDWLDNLGLEAPGTMAELQVVMKAFMEKDPNGNGQADEVGIMGADYTTFRHLGVAYGLTMITGGGWGIKDGKVYSNWTADAYRQLLTDLHDMYVDGVVPLDFDRAAFDDKPEYAARDGDRLGFVIRGWTLQLGQYHNPTDLFKTAVPHGVWVPVIWKETPWGKPLQTREPLVALWRVLSVTTACKDPIATIRFIDYVFAGEGTDVNRLGLEGVTYNMVDGKIVRDPNFRDKLEPGVFSGHGYMPGLYPEEYPEMDVMVQEFGGDTPENRATAQFVLDWYEKCLPQVQHVFVRPIPTAEDGTRLSELSADYRTYRDEMYSRFIRGDLDIRNDSAWNDYLGQMKALGDEEMREIFQRGVDGK